MNVLPDAAFWRNKRVLVTGHTGFKGGWLTLWLHQLGATLAGYALPPPTEPNFFTICGLRHLTDHHLGDVRDPSELRRAIEAFQPEVIFHLAAQSLVRASYADPTQTYTTNVMGTVHVLEAARHVPSIDAVVVVTSDKCYAEDAARLPYQESDKMGGHDPYSSSKGCAELVTASYARSFLAARGCAVASVRAGNVIGGGDWAEDRLVADLMRAFLAGNEPVLRSPASIRPWQHVLDPLSGYLLAAEQLLRERTTEPECWNFGPDARSEVSVRDVAQTLCRLWGRGATVRMAAEASAPHETSAPHEAAVLRLDSSKARDELGWSPRWSLDEALTATAEWFEGLVRGEEMGTLSRRQIEAYVETGVEVAQ